MKSNGGYVIAVASIINMVVASLLLLYILPVMEQLRRDETHALSNHEIIIENQKHIIAHQKEVLEIYRSLKGK